MAQALSTWFALILVAAPLLIVEPSLASDDNKVSQQCLNYLNIIQTSGENELSLLFPPSSMDKKYSRLLLDNGISKSFIAETKQAIAEQDAELLKANPEHDQIIRERVTKEVKDCENAASQAKSIFKQIDELDFNRWGVPNIGPDQWDDFERRLEMYGSTCSQATISILRNFQRFSSSDLIEEFLKKADPKIMRGWRERLTNERQQFDGRLAEIEKARVLEEKKRAREQERRNVALQRERAMAKSCDKICSTRRQRFLCSEPRQQRVVYGFEWCPKIGDNWESEFEIADVEVLFYLSGRWDKSRRNVQFYEGKCTCCPTSNEWHKMLKDCGGDWTYYGAD